MSCDMCDMPATVQVQIANRTYRGRNDTECCLPHGQLVTQRFLLCRLRVLSIPLNQDDRR